MKRRRIYVTGYRADYGWTADEALRKAIDIVLDARAERDGAEAKKVGRLAVSDVASEGAPVLIPADESTKGFHRKAATRVPVAGQLPTTDKGAFGTGDPV